MRSATVTQKLDTVSPPAARIDPVYDTAFGVTTEDRYRWMEQWRCEELQSWLRAQAAYSRTYLDALPDRSALGERIYELGDALSKISGLFLAGERCFYLDFGFVAHR